MASVHAPLSSSACSALLRCSHGELFVMMPNEAAMGMRQDKSCSGALGGWKTCLPELRKVSKVFK